MSRTVFSYIKVQTSAYGHVAEKCCKASESHHVQCFPGSKSECELIRFILTVLITVDNLRKNTKYDREMLAQFATSFPGPTLGKEKP